MFDFSTKKLGQFDLIALLKALELSGVRLEDLLFEGNSSLSSSSHLCEEITLAPDTISSAIVRLNLGLLTGSSPLPSYYRKCMENGEIEEESFITFIQFFNHHLIKSLLKFCWIDRFFLTDWESKKTAHISMFGLDSLSSIYWVCSLYFPELELSVEKSSREQRLPCPEFCLGLSQLGGKYALGGYTRQKIPAYTVALRSDVAQTDMHVFWPTEIRNRLKEWIFPLIRNTHIYLIVSFTIDQYNRATYLNKYSYMGFTSLGETTSNFTWFLFEGYGS